MPSLSPSPRALIAAHHSPANPLRRRSPLRPLLHLKTRSVRPRARTDPCSSERVPIPIPSPSLCVPETIYGMPHFQMRRWLSESLRRCHPASSVASKHLSFHLLYHVRIISPPCVPVKPRRLRSFSPSSTASRRLSVTRRRGLLSQA